MWLSVVLDAILYLAVLASSAWTGFEVVRAGMDYAGCTRYNTGCHSMITTSIFLFGFPGIWGLLFALIIVAFLVAWLKVTLLERLLGRARPKMWLHELLSMPFGGGGVHNKKD